MRLAFMGTPAFAVSALNAIVAAGHEVAAVYTQPPAPRGRGHVLQPSAVQAQAQALGLAVRTPATMRDPAEITAFEALALDAAVVVAYGQILVRAVLEAPRLGCFNVHASLLPRWRGAAPIQRAIMAGDDLTGVQVMRMSEGLDEGPVLAAETVQITPADTAETLAVGLSLAAARLLPPTLAAIARGDARETPQVLDGITYAKKIRPLETRVDWMRPAQALDRHIRGLSPAPGAWFQAPSPRGPVRVKALMSRFEPLPDREPVGAPGEVLVDRLTGDGLWVACREGTLRLLRLQREGRAPQDAADFLRGLPLMAGARLG